MSSEEASIFGLHKAKGSTGGFFGVVFKIGDHFYFQDLDYNGCITSFRHIDFPSEMQDACETQIKFLNDVRVVKAGEIGRIGFGADDFKVDDFGFIVGKFEEVFTRVLTHYPQLYSN